MIKKQLNILLQLATIDRTLDQKEKKLIEHLARMNNVPQREIDQMLTSYEPIKDFGVLSEEEKFEYLYMVIQLMKIDGQVFKSEIVFCEDIAEKLGYKKGVVAELSKNIYSDPSITADRDMLRSNAARYRA